MKQIIQSIIRRFGYNVSRATGPDADLFNSLCRYASEHEDNNNSIRTKFIDSCVSNFHLSASQRFQDVLADVIMNGESGVFCEFGATDGISLSNSYFLEKYRGWTGILAEPGQKWHAALARNRPNAIIDHRCVYSTSGETVSFNEAAEGEYSSIAHFNIRDSHTAKRKNSRSYDVSTISLNDLLTENNIAHIDFLSIDTEGSEFSILSSFDFGKFGPKFIAVEHNYTNMREKIFDLLSRNGYVGILRDLSGFDDWYIAKDLELASKHEK